MHAEDHQRDQGGRQHVAAEHAAPALVADRRIGFDGERQHEPAVVGEDRVHRRDMRHGDEADRPRDGIAERRPPAAADQQVEFDRSGDGEIVRLHGERHAGHQADGDRRAARQRDVLGTRHRGDQVGRAGHEHDVLALAEMLVGQHGEKEQQHRRQQRLGQRMIGRWHEPHQPPAGPEGGEDPGHHPGGEPEGGTAPQELGGQHRQRMHHEGERQVLVDDLDIEPLAADPAARDVEDRRDVVIDGREEVAGQPQDGQGEQRHQQQPFDARRDYRGFGRDGWQGGTKIS